MPVTHRGQKVINHALTNRLFGTSILSAMTRRNIFNIEHLMLPSIRAILAIVYQTHTAQYQMIVQYVVHVQVLV